VAEGLSGRAGVRRAVAAALGAVRGRGRAPRRERPLRAVVHREEQRCARRRPDQRGAHAAVHAAEPARREEPRRRLQPRLQCVDRVQREVDGCACEAACKQRLCEGREEEGVGLWGGRIGHCGGLEWHFGDAWMLAAECGSGWVFKVEGNENCLVGKMNGRGFFFRARPIYVRGCKAEGDWSLAVSGPVR